MNDDEGLPVAEVDFSPEVWWKVWCPRPTCGKVNWFCNGDLTDLTRPDIEGMRCCHCTYRWIAPEVAEAVQMSGDDHVCCTEGRPTPS